MRVAVVAEWYPSPGDPVLGIWAHRQAVAARDAGAEVRVLALRRPIPPLSVARRLFHVPPATGALSRWIEGARTSLRPTELDGLEVTPVPFVAPPRPVSYGSWGYWMAPPLRRALDRLYADWQFDVLHAHCLAPPGHAAARWIARRRTAFVVSAHGPDMINVPENSFVGRRACVAAMAGRGPGGCEQRLGGAALRGDRGARARRCVSSTSARTSLRPRQPTTAGLGSSPSPTWSRASATGVVLRALSLIDPERRPEYLVIGDGPCREGLERLAVELGVADRVRFLGQLPNPEAVARAAGCDLFVMPGVEEPFGVAFVEAMAAGLPAIGSRGEGGPEDIAAAGPGMILVEPDDAGALASVLERIVGDRSELARLGAAARETVAANFTWERCGVETVAAYRAALEARSAR